MPARSDAAPRCPRPVAAAPKESAEGPAGKPDVAAEERERCAEGLVFVDDKCGRPKQDRPYLCKMGDAADCAKQCDRGHAQSCDRLAVMVSTGRAGPPDPAKANDLFEKACKGGSAGGCANLGLRLWYSKKDPARALRFLEQACNEGEPRGCAVAAEAYQFGQGGAPKDARRALRLYAKGCDGVQLPRVKLAQGKKPEGDGLLKKACDMKDTWACDLQKRLKGK